MPADLIGTNVVLETPEGGRRFEFQPGPVFANLVLADEINRATPKTQSALLEAMQERSVTVAGKTHSLGRPFFVLATQNPLEMEGTYPLPEAQLDRFFFKLLVKFPSAEEMEAILDRTTEAAEPQRRADLRRPADRRALPARPADPDRRRAAALRHRARPGHPPRERAWPPRWPGATSAMAPAPGAPRPSSSPPRSGPSSTTATTSPAKICGPCAHPALRHRLILNFEGQAENVQADDIIDDILKHGRSARPGRPEGSSRLPRRNRASTATLAKRPANPGVRIEVSHVSRSFARGQDAAVRLRLPQEAGVPLAGLAAGLPRPAPGPAADDAARRRHRVRRPPRVHARRRLPLPRLERLRPPRRAACSSGSRKRKTCTSTSCSTARGAWASASPPKFDYARQVAAALAYIALADLDRVAVVAFAGDIVADFPLTRGKARILSLLKFLEGLEPQGSRDRPGPRRARASSTAASGGGWPS